MSERNRAERRRASDYSRLVRSEEHLALANEALTHQAVQLAQADRRKDEFLAVLGHELRNPLAPLQNSLDLLARSNDPRVLSHARAIMERQLRHLVRLVDDLLDVSRIRSGKIILALQRTDLAAAVRHAVELAQPAIDSRGHELEVSLPDEPTWIDADATRLPQLLANLLNNAAKYTPEGGRITLAVERPGREVIVRVRDTGIGMSEQELASVFELFAQARGPAHALQGGLGVGLSLAKSLAELHGGMLSAHSAGAGRGSEFVLRLPEAPPPASASAEIPSQAANVPSQRVLVVDDNVDAAESLRMLLEGTGHAVATAYSGREALASARSFEPDALILDLGMPDMDGYSLARALRAEPVLSRARLIALSGYGQAEDRRRTAAAGFDVHLVKPVEPAELEAALLRAPAA
jgi:CheY-like chemotaxis protein/nitrogen-specific signal transduction histidine kinase